MVISVTFNDLYERGPSLASTATFTFTWSHLCSSWWMCMTYVFLQNSVPYGGDLCPHATLPSSAATRLLTRITSAPAKAATNKACATRAKSHINSRRFNEAAGKCAQGEMLLGTSVDQTAKVHMNTLMGGGGHEPIMRR